MCYMEDNPALYMCMSAMGVAAVTHDWSPVTKQWEAERSHLSDMIEAPQTCPLVRK